jgi:lipid II:glycine glycyltransferase (peptidoglycan interpeptide bridge formation enzyme)
MQTALWSGVKQDWKFQAIVIRDDNKITGSIGILIKKLPHLKYNFAYAPRGPICDIYNKERLEQLLQAAKDYCQTQKCVTLIIDPYIRMGEGHFTKVADRLGFRVSMSKTNFNNIQPQYNSTLSLSNKTEEQLLNSFDSKTRYNIRLAARKGVIVSTCDTSYINEFYRLMVITGKRDNFSVRSKEYFEKLLSVLGQHARLYMAFYNEKAIAGTITIQYGDLVWYLYGASDNEYRNLMPNYALQWEMIKWGLETNSSLYDFGGVPGDNDADNPLYGLYKFKKGFGAEVTELVGEYSYVFKPQINLILQLAKRAMKILKGIRKRVQHNHNRA